jgi:4a-hydroxytetrahydrobiopterin dehydratase
MDLTEKKCKPCEGGIPQLSYKEIEEYKKCLNEDWNIEDGKKLTKEFLFVNFRHTMDFVNKIASLAEEEGHHPDMYVSYSKLKIELWTHAINGLSENDFILAAKIDKLQI